MASKCLSFLKKGSRKFVLEMDIIEAVTDIIKTASAGKLKTIM